MYDSNRAQFSLRMTNHTNRLWATMRQDSHGSGGPWLCAYMAAWVEAPAAEAVTETLFATL